MCWIKITYFDNNDSVVSPMSAMMKQQEQVYKSSMPLYKEHLKKFENYTDLNR